MTMNSTVVKTAVKRRPPNAGKGRVAGVPNKATADARLAISTFVNENSYKLQEWLNKVADGDGGDVKPNPAKAFELFQSVVEYHIPKLARSEQVGDGGGAIKHEFTWLK